MLPCINRELCLPFFTALFARILGPTFRANACLEHGVWKKLFGTWVGVFLGTLVRVSFVFVQ